MTKQEKAALRAAIEENPVLQRAYDNGYRKAKRFGMGDFSAGEAGLAQAQRAFEYIEKQRAYVVAVA